MPINISNIKNKIVSLCFCESGIFDLEQDSEGLNIHDGCEYVFEFEVSVDPVQMLEIIKTRLAVSPKSDLIFPDVILVDLNKFNVDGADLDGIDSFFNGITRAVSHCSPLVILLFNLDILTSDMGASLRLKALQNKFLFLIKPFFFEEFDLMIRGRIEHQDVHKRLAWQDNHLGKSLEYIEKLKQSLVSTRKELAGERQMLHNSLKQITLMTKERETLRKDLEQKRFELYENLKGIEAFLSSMIETKNEMKKGHALRVSQIALVLAEKFHIGDSSLKILEKAALLHDAGMLLIPPSVLVKSKDEHTDYEKRMILLHPARGADFLGSCPGFEKAAEIIRYLNENVDGSGSPDGLKRRYIPVLSRILAGADFLDTWCIENIDYSMDDLLLALEESAGARLDPSVVNLLGRYAVTYLNKDSERLREYPVYLLEPGMVTGAGLFTKTGTKLFSAGTKLTEASINMMIRYNREYPVDETVFIKVK